MLINYLITPIYKNFIRNGFIGFNSAVISDCCSNSFRVIKTTRQTHENNISYRQIIYKNKVKSGDFMYNILPNYAENNMWK